MKVKWTLQWLFVSIILGLDYLQKISATPNEGAVSYIPALECYDPYGKPQVNINSNSFVACVQFGPLFYFFVRDLCVASTFKPDSNKLKTCTTIFTFISFRLSWNFPRMQHQHLFHFSCFFAFSFSLYRLYLLIAFLHRDLLKLLQSNFGTVHKQMIFGKCSLLPSEIQSFFTQATDLIEQKTSYGKKSGEKNEQWALVSS